MRLFCIDTNASDSRLLIFKIRVSVKVSPAVEYLEWSEVTKRGKIASETTQI